MTKPGRQEGEPDSRNGVFCLVDQVLVSGSRFLITILIARSVGEELLGVYALVLSLLFLALIVQQTLLTTPYANFRHRNAFSSDNSYFSSLWWLSACLTLFAAASLLLTGLLFGILSSHFDSATTMTQLATACAWTALAAPFFLQIEFFRRVLLIRMQAGRALALDATYWVSVITLICIAFAFDQASIQNVFLILAVSGGLPLLAAIRFMVKQPFPGWRKSRSVVGLHLSFGKWIFCSEAMTFGKGNLTKWIISGFLGIGAVGIYSACDSLMRAVNPIFLAIASVAEPTLARGFAKAGKKEVRRITFKVLLFMIIGTLPVCIGVALGSRLLLETLYSPAFSKHWIVVVYLAFSSFVFSMSYPFGNAIQAMDRPEINFWIRVATFFVVIIGAIICAPAFGIEGIAAVYFAGTVISLVLRVWFFRCLVAGKTRLDNDVDPSHLEDPSVPGCAQ